MSFMNSPTHMPQEGEGYFIVVKSSYSKDFPKASTGSYGMSKISLVLFNKCVQNIVGYSIEYSIKSSHPKDFPRVE